MENIGKNKILSQRTGHLMAQVAALMQTSLERKLKKHGVTRSQWLIMAAIFGKDAETAADIAKIWRLDATAVTRLVDRLEVKGLVKRLHDEGDRRVNKLELTEEGRKLSPILKNEADKNHDYIFGVLSKSEEEVLRDSLSKILRQLSS